MFAADEFRVTPSGVEVTGLLTKYGSALATQDALEWELLTVLGKYGYSERTSPSDLAKNARILPLRYKTERRSSYLINPYHRHYNAMAVAMVIVYNAGGDEYKVLFGKRSGETAAHADLCHVIPAGMFQPECGDALTEWNVYHCIMKEYGEELFSYEIEKNVLDATYFYSEWTGVASLLAALDEGKCEFKITGLIVNLLNFRPEICCLLLVRDADWWARQRRTMRPNWEYVPRQELLDAGKPGQSDFLLDSIEQQFEAQFAASAGMWVPPGLAALWLGVDAARRALS